MAPHGRTSLCFWSAGRGSDAIRSSGRGGRDWRRYLVVLRGVVRGVLPAGRARDRGIRLDGTYLDVFAIVPAEECFHPAHRMNRRECLELRAECFHIIRDLEGIASSEEPVDYAIPHLHLVHHGPYPEGGVLTELTGSEENRALPMAPLWCLVYHDALLLPWSDPTQAALYGGMPYLGLTASDADIAAVGRICRLHAKVALEEMVDHEFLNEDHTRQRTTFADGTVVTADIGAKRWKMGKRSIGCADAKRRKQTR